MNMAPTPCPNHIEAGYPDGSRPTLVFLHGIGGRAFGWQPILEYCRTKGWHSLAWDMPAYGDSPGVLPYDFEHLALALDAMLERAHASRVVLVGHSMGGMVAQEYVSRFPAKVAAMVLIATSPAFGNNSGDFQRAFISQRLAPIQAGLTMHQVAEKVVPQMLGTHAEPQALEAACKAMGSIQPEAYQEALQALVAFDRRSALPYIVAPTLCIAGELDTTAPPSVMEKMAKKIAASTYCCVAGVGHLLTFEQPLAVADIMLNYLEEHL